MIDIITTGGKEYYIRFGFNALRIFSNENNMSLTDMDKLGQEISLQQTLSLIHVGFREGHRKMKLPFELTIDDVADLLDDDPTLMQRSLQIFQEHIGNFAPQGSKGKKKVNKKK